MRGLSDRDCARPEEGLLERSKTVAHRSVFDSNDCGALGLVAIRASGGVFPNRVTLNVKARLGASTGSPRSSREPVSNDCLHCVRIVQHAGHGPIHQAVFDADEEGRAPDAERGRRLRGGIRIQLHCLT